MITKVPPNLTQKYKFQVLTHLPSHWPQLAQLVPLAQPLVQVWKFLTWKLAQRVELAQPLAHASPASMRICIIMQISVLHNSADKLIRPTSRLAPRVSKSA